MLFHTIQGNGGARGVSHIVILFNPLRPKSELNEIYHLSVREIMTIENMISPVKILLIFKEILPTTSVRNVWKPKKDNLQFDSRA